VLIKLPVPGRSVPAAQQNIGKERMPRRCSKQIKERMRCRGSKQIKERMRRRGRKQIKERMRRRGSKQIDVGGVQG
jgi:hypothetical protein